MMQHSIRNDSRVFISNLSNVSDSSFVSASSRERDHH